MEIEVDEFHALQKQIIDLQDCCSEWEKQALDYKAELIKTEQALDVVMKALESATEYLGNQEPLVDVMAMNLHIDLSNALDQVKQIIGIKE